MTMFPGDRRRPPPDSPAGELDDGVDHIEAMEWFGARRRERLTRESVAALHRGSDE